MSKKTKAACKTGRGCARASGYYESKAGRPNEVFCFFHDCCMKMPAKCRHYQELKPVGLPQAA